MTLSALRVLGPYKGPSGYEHHVREFVRQLRGLSIDIELNDLPQWSTVSLDPALQDPFFDTLSRTTPARVALHFAMPHHVEPCPGMLNANFTMFEATRIHPDWIERNRRHDLVILPTESSRQAWIASGMPADRIRLCPLGVDPVLYAQDATPLPLRRDNGAPVAEYKTRFLNISRVDGRKNLTALLKVWIRATSYRDSAILLLKPGFYEYGSFDVFRYRLAGVQTMLGKSLQQAAPIQIVPGTYRDAEMPRLYAAATHYISMSHGEGWDLPMTEAAASGLKLIAPDHSGYQAYLDASVARLIPSRLVPTGVPGDNIIGPLFENASWWEPDEDAAIALIRSAIDGTDESPASARDRILSEFTWEKATRRLIEVLSELEDRKTRRATGLFARLHKRG